MGAVGTAVGATVGTATVGSGVGGLGTGVGFPGFEEGAGVGA